MAIDLTILAADRAAVIADMPVNVSFDGQTISCRKSVLYADDRAAAAGLLEDYVFSIHSTLDSWTEGSPEVGDLVSIADVEYRVLRLASDPVGLRLDLGAKYTDRK